MEYKVMISEFEGPLDLLLHLIKEDNLKIEDIKVDKVTKQYLSYIKAMDSLKLDVASEYLVMAAELLEIKSRMLLPNEQAELDDFEGNPEEELIRRLTEYQKYKEIVHDLKVMEEERRCVITKSASDLTKIIEPQVEIEEDNLDVNVLIEAFAEFMKRKQMDAPLNTKITKREMSVRKRSLYIMNKLKKAKNLEFTELFEEVSKEYIIVTFLSILDLAKKGNIKVNQDINFKKIMVSVKEGVN